MTLTVTLPILTLLVFTNDRNDWHILLTSAGLTACCSFSPHTSHDQTSCSNKMPLLSGHSKSYIFNHSQRQRLNLQRGTFGCLNRGNITHELLHALGFHHQHRVPYRDNYVIINWQNIEPGNVSVFTHIKPNNDAPVPCAQITHKDITFTPHPSHYYVQQKWLFRQRAVIAEMIVSFAIPLV